MEAFSSQLHDGVRQRDHENQKRDGKGPVSHPSGAEEQKSAGCGEAHKRESRQAKVIVDTQARAPNNSCDQCR
jgi:hypothetical protein